MNINIKFKDLVRYYYGVDDTIVAVIVGLYYIFLFDIMPLEMNLLLLALFIYITVIDKVRRHIDFVRINKSFLEDVIVKDSVFIDIEAFRRMYSGQKDN